MVPVPRSALVAAGVAILASFALFGVAHVLHPADTHDRAGGAALDHIAAADAWTLIHILFIVGTVLYLPFFRTLADLAPGWGHYAFPAAVLAIGLDIVAFAAEGGFWRALADAYVLDPASGASVLAVFAASRDLVAWTMLVGGSLWGLATVAVAWCAFSAGHLPRWLAVLGVVAGTMVFVGRIGTFVTDRAAWTFAIQGSPTAFWELGFAFWAFKTAWRPASTPDDPTTATS